MPQHLSDSPWPPPPPAPMAGPDSVDAREA
jgi:hypothetical protein